MSKILLFLITLALLLPIIFNWFQRKNCCGLGGKTTPVNVYPTISNKK